MGGILRTMKDYKKSEEYFEKALELNNNDVHHLSNYADLLREVGKYKESKIKFNRAVSIIQISELNRNKKGKRNSLRSKRRNSGTKRNSILTTSLSSDDLDQNKSKKG